MVQVLTVSGYTAGWAMEAMKPAVRTPPSVEAREKRVHQIRRENDGIDEDDIEELPPTVQSTSVSLDLLTEGNRQPQPSVPQVIAFYAENE